MFQLHPPKPTQTTTAMAPTPFLALTRAFFEQFFTSESVTSDVRLRQALIGALAFLLAPGMFLMIELFPEFSFIAIRVRLSRLPMSRLDDLLAWTAFLFTTYSMAATGLVTVMAWNSLTFDRRDAMVLGPLPLKPRTILGAKFCALGLFLLTASLPINFVNATMFASVTADQFGGARMASHFIALLVATVGGGVLSFALIVMLRATVALVGGPHLAAACGPPLQFLCIVGLLSLFIFCPFVLDIPFLSAGFTNALPSAWFVGVFERLRHSPRAFDPRFPIAMLAQRALFVTSVALAGAVTLSIVEFGRHLRFTIAPPASPGVLGNATAARTIARLMAGRNRAARAIADFILLTLARNRAHRAPIAINAAIGTAIIIAALSQHTSDLASVMRPRTAVLWVPLVVGYWTTVGMRASFFIPSELASSWAFRVNAADPATPVWAAVRAAMIAFILPRTLLVTVLLVPLIGWYMVMWHAVVVAAVVVLFIELVALTIDHVPFTQPYRPGHAKLKTRWSVYLAGVYVFAYVPARLELRLGASAPLFATVAGVIAVIAALEIAGHWRSSSGATEPGDEIDESDLSEVTVLDLGGAIYGGTGRQ